MRARTSISQKPRYTATLTDFKGVDLNTSPLRVAQNRASSMKNFICDNGVNHKRPGWEEQFRIVEGGEALAIHGVFPYNEGEREILLVHAGTGIYRAEKGKQKWTYTRLDDGELGIITKERSQCFYRDGKAFLIGCGNYLVYGEFDGAYALKQVADIAYVPTTSIGIKATGAGSLLDEVNLLTKKRINTIVGSEMIDGKWATFSLDSDVDLSMPIVIEGTFLLGSIDDKKWKVGSFRLDQCQDDLGGYTYVNGTIRLGAGQGGYDTSGIPIIEGAARATIEGNQLTFNFINPSADGNPNITVTYYANVPSDYDTKKVQGCRFGATFGLDGADDRLFLAGNSKYPNWDIWSEYDDFTYFPDGNTMEVGGAHAAITAYARLSDTTLAVLKEEKAGEPTIFYRTGRERTEKDGVTLKQWFPVSAGIAGDGTLNPHAVATLSGDVLTLTRGGVHGIVLSSNVASGERYTRERSRPIYRELTSADLGTAAAIVYRNRYYLALPGTGKCFVADAHYKAMFEGSTDYNYEWWVWENVHATCFAEYKDQLIFGTPAGLVCAFTEGVFADRTHTELGTGDILDEENGSIIFSADAVPAVGDLVTITGNVYSRLAENVKEGSSNNRIVVTEKEFERLFVGREVCLASGNAYTVKEADPETLSIKLANESGNTPAFTEWGFSIFEAMDGVERSVKSVDEDSDTFVVADETGEELFLATLGDAAKWTGQYTHVMPVEAEWFTPMMDFGTNAQSKTLLQLTVATEPGIQGHVTFGYETRRVYHLMSSGAAMAVSVRRDGQEEAPSEGTPFSFDALDFNNLTFDTSFAHSYTKRVSLRNFNFIQFRFGSDTDEDCAVSGVTLIYKINQNNRGVR